MKRALTLLSFLSLAVLFSPEGQAQPAAYNTDCHPCHAGAGGLPVPTVGKGFGYGGWDAAFTRMRTFQPSIPTGDRAVIVNYLESTFPLSGNAPTSSGPGFATPPSLPSATQGTAYSQSMIGTGSNGPYTWSPISVSPSNPNLSISAAGLLSGTPNASGTFTITFTVSSSSAPLPAPHNSTVATFTRTLTIAAPPPLSITGPASLSAGTVGTAYTAAQFTSTGGTGGNVWTATGLPSGMSISSSGLLSGTPAAGSQAGSPYNPQFKVTDSSNAFVTVNRSLTINPAPLSITGPASLSAGTVGTAYTAVQFTSSGGTGGNVWTATGLPTGMSISSSGLLSGTPAVGSQAGSPYNPQFKVTDSSNAFVTVNRSLTINPAALVITGPGSLSAGTVGASYAAIQFTSSGGTGGNVWTATGLPSGLAISSGGLLSGTPAVGSQAGSPYNPQFKVTDSSNAFVTVNLSLTINPAGLAITGPGSLSAGTEGASYPATQFTFSGGTGGSVWTATGLPTGLAISATGLLTGTPAAGSQAGSPYNPQFKVTDSSNAFVTVNLSLTINPTGLAITGPGSLSAGTTGVAYPAVQFTSSGGTGGNVWTATGLPNGLAISATGLLSGTPAAGSQAGSPYNPQFKVTDSSNAFVTVNLSLTINSSGLSITGPGSLSSGTVGAAYPAVQFTSSGGTGGNVWTATGLPSGLSISASGLLTGTPAAGSQAGSPYNPQFKVTDSSAAFVTVNLALTITAGGFSITGPGSLPAGTVGIAYSPVQFTSSGGAGGNVWTATGLPSGMTISASGQLSGTPAAGSQAGSPYNPQFKVTDSSSAFVTTNVALTINPPSSGAPVITSMSPNPILAAVGQQTLFINGSGFQSGAGLRVHLASGIIQSDLTGANVIFLSTTQLLVHADVGATAATWNATVINPNTLSSNAFTFSVQAAQNTTFALPQFVFGGGWYTALYFANTTTAVLHIQVNFIADTGGALLVPLTGIGPVTSQSIDVNPQSTVILEAPNAGAIAQQGWAEVTLPTGVTGYAVFRQTVAGRADQEAVVPLTPESSQIADLTYDDTGFTTSVSFLNPTAQALTMTINTFDVNGAANGTAQQVLGPRSKTAIILKNVQGLAGINGQRGRAIFSVPNGALCVLGLRFGGSAFTSIPVVHRPTVAETRTISFALPQFVFGGAWYTALYFSNTTNAPINVPVTFIANNAAALSAPLVGIGSVTTRTVVLAAGGTAILEAPNGGAAGEGWVEATLPPGVTGYAVFRQVIPGRENQEAVVPLTTETSQAADLVYDDIAFTTSVAFLNPSDQQATVTIVVYSATGVQVGFTQVVLAPQSKTSTILKNLPGLSAMSGNRGWAAFSVPNGDVSVLGLRFGGEAFTSIPVRHR